MLDRKEAVLVELMMSMEKTGIQIVWDEIVRLQTVNLKNGLNRVGIPDLIIAQNAVQNGIRLFSLDGHFELMQENLDLKLYSPE